MRDDLAADPYLLYILGLATLLAGFWFWHRIPNFATRDEQSRLLDPMVAFGTVLGDPGLESLREGVAWGRVPFGATFYLFGLALVPVVVAAVLRGQLEAFLAFQSPRSTFGYWAVWHATPEWIWTWSIALVRLFNVAFAVGSVYLTYRIGTAVRDRATGRLAALLLTVTFGFLTIAHEGGEDMPMLFVLLSALYLLIVYVRTGDATFFLSASALGGLAIAFKLTAAPVVLVVGAAHLLRAHRVRRTPGTPDGWRSALVRPRLVLAGAGLGLAAILLGFPTLLVGEVDLVVERVFGGSMARSNHPTGPDAPIWWWFLRQYFQAFGLPLFLGVLGGLAATAASVRDPDQDAHGTVLVVTTLSVLVLLFSFWHDFRVHHLLPTFPLLVVLLAAAVVGLRGRSRRAARAVTAVLVITAGTYAVVGTASYADAPRDAAADWFDEHAEADATVEVYRVNVQDTAVPHWMDANYPWMPGEERDPCPEYVMLGYRDLLHLVEGSYYRNDAAHARYVSSLLAGEYDYEVVAEFGPRPENYVPRRATPGSLVDLLGVGVVPWTDQYADEQELRANQWTAILERTGPCGG